MTLKPTRWADMLPGTGDSHGFPEYHPKLGIRGPSTITRIAGDNKSDESILGPEYRDQQGSSPSPGAYGIHVKQDVQINWSEGSQASDSRG